MNSRQAIQWIVFCLFLSLVEGAHAQPWPWPASASGDVHEVFQNYGKYQDFFSIPLLVSPYNPNPYCHDGLDIAINDGDGIYSVTPIGASDVVRVVRPPESRRECKKDSKYWKAILYPWRINRSGWDGGWMARRYFTLEYETTDHCFSFTHIEPWSVDWQIANAQYFGIPYTCPLHTKLAEVVDWFSWFGKDHIHYMITDVTNDLQLNPVKCLDPNPALLSGCGIEYDGDSDKRFTFRYAEDEDEDDATYFEKIEVPEGGQTYLYHVLWGNVDVITRCWDQYQQTGDNWKLTPYEIGLKLGRYNYSTSTLDVLVDYSPLVVFDGWVSDATGRRAIWSYDVNNSEAYTHVIYENDNTNDSAGGFGVGEEFSFVLTNQDGVLDGNGRPVIELSDADYYWDTNGKVGDDWNDDDETQAHEATSQSDALFPDRKYYVGSMPKDHQGRDALLWKKVIVDNFAPYVAEIKARLERGTTREEIVFYEAEWVDGTLMITREPCRPVPGDVIKIDVWFSEAMRDEGIEVKLIREGASGGLPEYPLVQESLESEEFENDHWTGRITPTTWGSLRNMLEGKLYVSVEAYDKAGNGLDSDPSTVARRIDRDGNWEDYEDADGNPTTTGDVDRWNHWFMMESYGELMAFLDVSASVANASNGWSPEAYHVVDRVLELMQEAHEGTVEDLWRASVFRYWGYPTVNDGGIEMLSDFGQGLEASRTALQGLWQGSIGNGCSIQGSPLDSVTAFMKDVSNRCRPRFILAIGDGEINRGNAIADQEEIWMRAACDTSYQTSTPIFAVMPIERAEMSNAMCRAVVRSGGKYFAVPGSMMYMDTPLAQIIFDLMDNYADIYAADVEEVTARAEHWFRVDEIVGNLILVGAWAQYALNLAQNEGLCGGGPTGCLDYEDGTDSLNAEMSTESKEEFLARMNENREWPEYEGDGEVRGGPRTSMTLYDANGVVVPATGTIGPDVVYWRLSPTSADTGLWHVTVDGAAESYQFEVAGKGGGWLELAGQRLLAESTAADILVRIVGTDSVSNPTWELLDENGQAVGDLSLADDGSQGDGRAGDGLFGGSWGGVSEDGLYRVRLKGEVGGARIERVTREGIWVVAAPTIAFIEPDGVGDETGSNFTIRWTGESELSATLSLFYDNDNTGADGDTIATGLPLISGEDSLRWNVFGVDEGDYYLYAEVEEDAGVNPAQVVYSDHQVTVTTGAQENFPVSTGGRVRASPVAVDLEDNGSELELVIASEDSCLYIYDYQANLLPGFPLRLAEKLSSTPAVGNIDTLTTSLELVVGARDDSGTLYCVDHNAGSVSGWPVSLGSPIWSAPTLADLDTPPNGDLEVIVACGSQVHVRRSDGTVFPGWPQTIGCSSVLFTSPCVANYDPSDDELEIAVCGGTDTLYVFDATGSLEWKERVVGSFVWSPLSSGDLDFDGSPEILVQTWDATQSRLYAFKGDGTAPAGWETPIEIGLQARSGAALGDLDGDGRIEVLVGDGNIGKVYGYASNGTALPGAWGSGIQIATRTYSPLCLADLDGDGSCEAIVLGINNDKMNVVDQNGLVLESWSRALDGDTYGAPAIADIDLDGDTEILIGTDAGTVFCFDFGGTYSPLRMECPKFQADLGNTGNYTEEIPPQPPTVETIEVVNGDELQLTWNTVSTDSLSRQELVTTYRVYRGSSAWFETGSLVGIVSMPETTYTDTTTGVVGDSGVNYAYEVTALDQHGNESRVSSRVGEHDFSSGGRVRIDRKESVER